MEAEGAQALSTVGCEVTVQTKDGEVSPGYMQRQAT